jgi:hypothetical protein
MKFDSPRRLGKLAGISHCLNESNLDPLRLRLPGVRCILIKLSLYNIQLSQACYTNAMPAESKICQSCRDAFVIDSADFDFYQKMQVPPPTFCPECRMIRRFMWRNERSLYKRACDLCGEEKIMMYPADAPFPVYCKPCWWSDQWDASSYARGFDPASPFFEQFKALFNAVPRPGIIHQGNIVDSDYTNRVTDQRSCYLLFGSIDDEYCRYGVWMNSCKDCTDCYNIQKCEQCYDCLDCFQCYRLRYSQECNDCSDSYFLYNCRNCQDCFGCVNLRNKRYCIFNEQYTKEEYQAKIASFQLGNALVLDGLRNRFEALKRQHIVPALVGYHNTMVSGSWIENCKNTFRSFNMTNIEDGKYCFSVVNAKDVMDYCQWGANSEKVYETINAGRQCANLRFANECWDQVINAEYVMNCHSSKDIFGSIGLRKKQYCILNKEYAKEEFEALAATIRAQMSAMPYEDAKGRTYAYGEYFPAELSPFAYNETIAQEFVLLSRDAALASGFAWREEPARNYSVTLPAAKVPATIQEANSELAKEIIGCAHAGSCVHRCTTAFRIIPEELAFYQNLSIPLPKLCPNCRHFERVAKRNPLRLWPRACQCAGAAAENNMFKNTAAHFHDASHCPNEFETSYAPDRSEIVYCEQCYQGEVA